MLFLLILCGAISAFACASLVRSGRRSAERYGMDVPQRFHSGHVPRLGGVGMMAACSAGWFWMAIAERYLGVANGIQFSPQQALAWCSAALMAACAGTAEDIWHQLRARWRLIFTATSAIAR